MKSSLDKIFYKVVYHRIIYMCDFFMNLDNFIAVVCTGFSWSRGFHRICSHFKIIFFSILFGAEYIEEPKGVMVRKSKNS